MLFNIITSASSSLLAIATAVTCAYLYSLFLSAGIQVISNIKGSIFSCPLVVGLSSWALYRLATIGLGFNKYKEAA